MLQLGSCKDEDIAARVLTRVIGHFPGARNQIIIDGGWLALSEQGFEELGGTFAVIKVLNLGLVLLCDQNCFGRSKMVLV